ncbi:MAG TPA: RNA polymerase sigma-70 factor [Rhodothermales bacterium]
MQGTISHARHFACIWWVYMNGRADVRAEDSDNRFAEWSRRIRKSDAAAYRALFEELHVDLLRFAWRFTLDEEAARDVVQEVFLKIWQIRETLDERRSLRALLYTMVKNRSLNYRRSRRDEERPAEVGSVWEPMDEVDLEEQSEAEMLEKRIHRWIDELPDRRREAFILSRYHGMTHEEIAGLMGLTPRTVNTHIVLALKDLRGKLDALELHSRS